MEINEYTTRTGANPYRKWFDGLRDIKAAQEYWSEYNADA